MCEARCLIIENARMGCFTLTGTDEDKGLANSMLDGSRQEPKWTSRDPIRRLEYQIRTATRKLP